MTEAELRKEIQRLQLEKQYMDLKRDTSSQNKGKTFASKYGGQLVDKLITNAGIDLVTQVAKYAGAKGIDDVIDKINAKIPDDKNKMESVYANNKKKN